MAVVAVEFELAEPIAEPVASEPEAESMAAARVFRLPSWPNYPVRLGDDNPALDRLLEWTTMDRQNF